mmetsp:Transcript_47148/g.86535  ORF Transcript_47148/g.86535 Transcript_47148/m.86535 type:complete len:199 (-) Transcript_47148:58-654(-)
MTSTADGVLDEVTRNGNCLGTLPEEFTRDRNVVLAAVQQNGWALRFAADVCRRDPQIVLTAVEQNGFALQHAAECCKSNREIVLRAVEQTPDALYHAADMFLEDNSFALEAKLAFFVLKVTMLSGRSTFVVSRGILDLEDILVRSCERLGVTRTGHEVLFHGVDAVLPGLSVCMWPGIQPRGQVTEYQLVVSAPLPDR